MDQLQKIHQIKNVDYYSVFTKNGNKICDVGEIQDALLMCSLDPTRYYKKNKILLDQIVNIPYTRMEDDKQLNPQKILPDNQQEPFVI